MRKIKKALIGLGLSIFLAGGAIVDHSLKRENSVVSQVVQTLTPDSSLESLLKKLDKDAGKERAIAAARIMKKQGYGAATLDENHRLKILNEIDERNLINYFKKPIVIRADSPILKTFYEKAEKSGNFVKENTSYLTFSQNVIDRTGLGTKDVGGLSVGKGVILIDSEADDGGIKNPKTYLSTMVHEAQHEKDNKEENKFPRLISEKRAYKKSIECLEEQLKTDNDLIVKAELDSARQVVETAEYLEKLGDFNNVYPETAILASALLKADIPVSTLEKYSVKPSQKSKKESELHISAYFARIARTLEREEAIKKIYEIISNPEIKGTLIEISGVSALQYLAPDAMKTQSVADIGTGRGMHFNFSEREKTNEVGRGFVGNDKYTVTGLPTLEEILGNEKWRDYKEGQNRQIEVIYYRLADVNQIKVDKHGNVYIPDREGKPSPSFYRFAIIGVDIDGNGRDDGIEVYYGSNSLTTSDGNLVGKIDVYDGRGNYTGSSIEAIRRGLKEKGENLNLNPQKLARDYGLEYRPDLPYYKKN